MNERLVWIDCEMTGLDLRADALIEVAALVTDFDLNVQGEGIDLIVRPPDEALDQMNDFVRTMHETSGLLDELKSGITIAEAEERVLSYIKEHCPDGSRPPLAGNTVATDRAFLARDMPTLEAFLHYRIVDVSSIKELARRWFPRAYFQARRQAGQPPGARRHPGEHRGAPLLPRDDLRALARSRVGRGSRDRLPPRWLADGLTAAPPDGRTTPDTRYTSLRSGRSGGSMVGIAQLVERRVVVADVAGSSPVTHPRRIEPLTCGNAVRGSAHFGGAPHSGEAAWGPRKSGGQQRGFASMLRWAGAG